MEILNVQDLCKSYGKGEAKVDALKHVSFSLEKGESRIKLVAGEDTRFDIQLEMTEGSFTELGF